MRPGFLVRHSLAHFRAEPSRTLFALFCIAAGVAAVVSLRSLGRMIESSLSSDLQRANRGDLMVQAPGDIAVADTVVLPDGTEARVDRRLFTTQASSKSSATNPAFTWQGEARLRDWAAGSGFEIQAEWTNAGPYAALHAAGTGARTEYVMIFGVEPDAYPYYGVVEMLQPAGLVLAQALAAPDTVVITDSLADKLGIGVGDTVTLAGARNALRVTGIADAVSQAAISDPFLSAFPYVYLAYESAIEIFHGRPGTFFVRIPPEQSAEEAKRDCLTRFPGVRVTSTEDRRAVNDSITSVLLQLATMAGLAALLIGGIGIAHTMTVIVRARMLEVAVLKTVGATSGDIRAIFLFDAALLGLAGGALGVGIGQLLVLLLASAAERFAGSGLVYSVQPEAMGMGLIMGIAVTVAFGLLPIFSAERVRPAAVLRPQAGIALRAGIGRTLLTMALLAAIIGILAGWILGDPVLGLAGTAVVMALLGVFLLPLGFLAWALGRLPSFGNPVLQLAQRGLRRRRMNIAGTLVALITGIFTLGAIWMTAAGSMAITRGSAEELLGGEILALAETVEAGRALEKRLARTPGVTQVAHDSVFAARVEAINGRGGADLLEAEANAAASAQNILGAEAEIRNFLERFTIKVRDPSNLPYRIAAGSDLIPEREDIILLEESVIDDAYKRFGLKPGDRMTLRFAGGARREVTIAGITRPRHAGFVLATMVAFRDAHAIALKGLVPPLEAPIPTPYLISADEASLDAVMDVLAVQPGVFMVGTRQLTAYQENILSQFLPFPIAAAALILVAAAVIISNGVMLSTLERRREIGILKAVGMPGRSVMGMLLYESALIGLAGGVLGAAMSSALILFGGVYGDLHEAYPPAVPALLVLLSLAICGAATLAAARDAVRLKPLEVLRYE